MITERKLYAGTLDELLEHYQDLFKDSRYEEITDKSIEDQLKSLGGGISYVFYLRRDVDTFVVEMDAIQLRDDHEMNKTQIEKYISKQL